MKKELQERQKEREQAIEILKKEYGIKKETKIYCVIRHISHSGMMRHISFFVYNKNYMHNITYYIAKICGYKLAAKSPHHAIKVPGCNYDHCLEVCSNLMYKLYKSKKVNYQVL